MKTIKLYGHLGKQFGRVHRYDVRTPAEAVKALMANFPEFKTHLLKFNEPGYKILVGKEDRSSLEELYFPADSDTIQIIPLVVGSGNTFKVILGVTLIIVGAVTGQPWLVKVGIAITAKGVAGLLFKPPKAEIRDAEKDDSGDLFNGPLNLSTQNNPVPLAYGQVIIGSQVIHAKIKTTRIPV